MVGVEERSGGGIISRCESAIPGSEGLGRVERQYKSHVGYRAGIIDDGIVEGIHLGVGIRVHYLLERPAGHYKNALTAVDQIALERDLSGGIDCRVLEGGEPAG